MRKRLQKTLVIFFIGVIVCTSSVYGEPQKVDKFSKASILIDQNTNRVLYEKEPDAKRPLASLSKMMTFLLAIEAIENKEVNKNDIITIDKDMAKVKGSTYHLKVGEKVPLYELMKGLMIVRGVKGRAEVVPTGERYTVMIDYAHTPDGIENILKAIKGFVRNRIIIVFGCGGDRDKDKRPKMGKIAAELADFCVVTSDNPRTENPEDIINDILPGLEGCEHYVAICDRTEAIKYALSIAKEGDVVLLAGKGHETYQDIMGEKIHYDEREIVKKLLEI